MSNPAIVAELKRIADANGGLLLPAAVVAAAQPVDSILHSRFEWNDDEAAHNYRLWQARQLIRITVEFIGAGDEAKTSNVFVSLTPDRLDGGYRTLVSVMRNTAQRDQLLHDALAELELFQRKYAELQELAQIFSEIEQVKRVQPTRQRKRRNQPAASAQV